MVAHKPEANLLRNDGLSLIIRLCIKCSYSPFFIPTEDLILPKAATSQKPAAKTSKTSTNGAGKTLDKIVKEHEFTDFVEVEQAKAEFNARRASQLLSIKKTDKKLLREMLYQMVLGRRFEEKCAEVY